jgi:hypothetical protein
MSWTFGFLPNFSPNRSPNVYTFFSKLDQNAKENDSASYVGQSNDILADWGENGP